MRWLAVLLVLSLPACDAQLGDPDAGSARDASSMDAASALDASSAFDAGDPGDAGPRTDAGPAGLVAVDPPAEPVFPDTIGILSVAIRTADETSAGTDDGIEICLNDTDCFALDTPEVDDYRRGEVDVYHFEGVDLPRAAVDQVTVRTLSTGGDNDRWTLGCLELRFDGEPVYCADGLDQRIGTGSTAGEVTSWSDPTGLHEACNTCQAGVLTHGPMQGAHDTDRARVWVRTDATRAVGLRMAGEGESLDDGPVVAWTLPRPENDFTAELEVPGLRPGVSYQARVEVLDETSPPFVVRTAPTPDDLGPVRFAFGSCTRVIDQPAFSAIEATAPDLMLMIGDNHYANTSFLATQRWHYRRFRAVPERASMFASAPMFATWDDHDFVGNNSDATCLGIDNALQSFGEYWANSGGGTSDTRGVFFRHRWGPMELFVLDCRTHRPDAGDVLRRCTDDPDATNPPASDGLLGLDQEAWLLDGLSDSDAPFKLLACGSRWTQYGSNDSWASFIPARDRLFDALDARGIEGVVLLSGDIHRSSLRRIARPRYDLPELTSSPIAYSAPTGCGATDSEETYCYDADNSFVVLDVEAESVDPAMVVRVFSGAGVEVHTETILLSELR